MKALELARAYLEIFYGNRSIEELVPLLSEELVFEGPFHKSTSARVYLQSLRDAPPEGMSYEIIESFGSDSKACVLYNFTKGEIHTPMSQYFEINDARISKILLIFDSRNFS